MEESSASALERERERELDILAPPGGFIRAYVDYAYVVMPAPVAYHIGAALALLATVGLAQDELSMGILLVGPPDRRVDLGVLSCAAEFAEDVMDAWAYRLTVGPDGPSVLAPAADQVALAIAPDYWFDPTSASKGPDSRIAEPYLVIPSVLVDTPERIRNLQLVTAQKRSSLQSTAAGLLDGLWRGARSAGSWGPLARPMLVGRKLDWQLRLLYEFDRHCGAAGPIPGAPTAIGLLLEESDRVLASRVSS